MKDSLLNKIKKATKVPSNTYYISWRCKIPEDEVKVIIQDLLEKGQVIESHYAKEYYQWVEKTES